MESIPSNSEIRNFYRLNLLVKVVPARYMALVFGWFTEGRSQSLVEFFQTNPSLFKKFDQRNKKKILDETKPANMDVSLLYKLLMHASDIPSSPEWHSPVTGGHEPSLGQVLHQLKESRNDDAHPDPEKLTKVTDGDLNTLADKQKLLLTQMLTLAGRQAEKSQDSVNEAVSRMEADVAMARRIKGGITVEHFLSLARREMLKKHNQGCPLYVEPRLVVQTQDAYIGTVVRLRDLFSRKDGSRPQVIHATGEAGAGKTSLCRAVFASWLKGGQLAQATADYQLVLSIACACVTSRDLHHYLCTWTLPETTRWCEDTTSLTRVLRKAKILWLVDGWDEATREARGLLREIFHSMTEAHTVLVTCRPELGASLTKLFVGNVLNVSLAGLDSNERKELISGMNLDNHRNDSTEGFLHWLKSCISEERELNNPLKLQLLLELWCRGQCTSGQRRLPSVVQMYMHRTQWQRDDLVARCEADAAPGLDVAGKIDAWLRRLYEVSFNSAKKTSSLTLNTKSVNALQEVGIRETLSLSTFLRYDPSTEPSSNLTHYAFYHDSQRCFYAAQYLEHCCEGSAEAEATLTKIIEADIKEVNFHIDPHLGIFDLFVQFLLVIKIFLSRLTCGWICREASREGLCEVVSRLRKKLLHVARGVYLPPERWVRAVSVKGRLIPVVLAVMEMWASGLFQANISARFLTDILARLLEGHADPAGWLEVVRRCGYNDDLVKEVSRKVSTKLWEIQDRDVSAATLLLRHVTPAEVRVVVSDNPKRLPDLPDLLSLLAERPVTLELHICVHYHSLNCKDSSDNYLGLVCREGSVCRLSSFTGHLSHRGLSHLAASPYLSILNLRIMQTLAVQELATVTPQLARLESLNLLYDNDRFVVPHSSLDGSIGVVIYKGLKSILTMNGIRNLAVNLQLPHLRDASVNPAINFISVLSKRYITLSVGKLDQKGIKTLVAGLNNNAVTVGNLGLPIYVKEYGRTLHFSLGGLPLRVPMKKFIDDLQDILKDPFGQMLLFNR